MEEVYEKLLRELIEEESKEIEKKEKEEALKKINEIRIKREALNSLTMQYIMESYTEYRERSVYIAKNRSLGIKNLYKIGCSVNPRQRMEMSRYTGEGYLKMLYLVHCANIIMVEDELHEMLKKYRVLIAMPGGSEYFYIKYEKLIKKVEEYAKENEYETRELQYGVHISRAQ
jgi:hypothetical protein